MESTEVSHVKSAGLEIREGVVWEVDLEGLLIPHPSVWHKERCFPYVPILWSLGSHSLLISEDGQTDQTGEFGKWTGPVEPDPSSTLCTSEPNALRKHSLWADASCSEHPQPGLHMQRDQMQWPHEFNSGVQNNTPILHPRPYP